MCGRFAFYSPGEAVASLFGVELPSAPPASWNIAPSQDVLVLRHAEPAGESAAILRWGLVPFWAKDPAIGNRMINARIETLAAKPAFRQALARRRCVILASGFYEWRADGRGKIPYYIRRRDERPFAMAGLWERWEKGTAPLETCTIITTDARAPIREIHDRMPVILDPAGVRAWLAPFAGLPGDLLARLAPVAGQELTFAAVSRAVNNPRNNGPDLVLPGADA